MCQDASWLRIGVGKQTKRMTHAWTSIYYKKSVANYLAQKFLARSSFKGATDNLKSFSRAREG